MFFQNESGRERRMTDPLIPNLPGAPNVNAVNPIAPIAPAAQIQAPVENMLAVIRFQQMQIAALKRAVGGGVVDVSDRVLLQNTLGLGGGADPLLMNSLMPFGI